MRNKGQIDIGIWIGIAIALFLMASFNMVAFKQTYAQDSQGKSEVLNNIVFYEQYLLKESEIVGRESLIQLGLVLPEGFIGPVLPVSEDELKETFKGKMKEKDLGIKGLEDYFSKIREGNFAFYKEGDKFVFEILDVTIKAEKGANSFNRKKNFRLEFDAEGIAEISGVEESEDVEELVSGVVRSIRVGERFCFRFLGDKHCLSLNSITNDLAFFEFSSEPISVVLAAGESKRVDINGDGISDINIIRTANDDRGAIRYTINIINGKMDVSEEVEGGEVEQGQTVSTLPSNFGERKLISSEEQFFSTEFELEKDYDSTESIYLLLNKVKTDIYFEDDFIYSEEGFIFDFLNPDTQIGWVIKNNKIKMDTSSKIYINSFLGNKGFDYFKLLDNALIDGKKITFSTDERKEVFDKELESEAEAEGAFSCGPLSLNDGFKRLGKEVGCIEMNSYRNNFVGGLLRGIGGIFSDGAVSITSPGEMKDIINGFGFEYEKIEDADIDKANRIIKERSDVIFIVRNGLLLQQHYEDYEGEVKEESKNPNIYHPPIREILMVFDPNRIDKFSQCKLGEDNDGNFIVGNYAKEVRELETNSNPYIVIGRPENPDLNLDTNSIPSSIVFSLEDCSNNPQLKAKIVLMNEYDFKEGWFPPEERKEVIQESEIISLGNSKYGFDVDASNLKKNSAYRVKIFCSDQGRDCFGTNFEGAWIRYFGVKSVA